MPLPLLLPLLRLLLLPLLLVAHRAWAQDAFIFPPAEGIDVLATEPVTISWLCDAPSNELITLTVYQNAGQSGDAPDGNAWFSDTLLDQVQDPGSYKWMPNTLQGLPITDGFHFAISYSENSFNSGALFIVNSLTSTSTTPSPTTAISSTTETSASTTSTTESSASTSTTTVTVGNSQSTPPVAPSSPLSSVASSSDNQDSMKIGLGVGLGIGLTLLLACGLGLFFYRRRRAVVKEKALEPHGTPYHGTVTSRQTRHKQEMDSTAHAVYEAPRIYAEVPGDGGRWELHA